MASLSGFLKLLKIRPRGNKEYSFSSDHCDDTDLVQNDEFCEDEEDRISHIYEEIPCSFVDDENILPTTHKATSLDFKHARDIGPYIVVPILGCYGSHVFRKDEIPPGADDQLPCDLLSKINCPRNRQFNVLDNAQLCENLSRSSPYCTIPVHERDTPVLSNHKLDIANENDVKFKPDSDDSCSEYDTQNEDQRKYFLYLAKVENNHKLKQNVLKLAIQPIDHEPEANCSHVSQDDTVSVTTNASDCTSQSSDSGNASLYTCSDMSSCSEGTGSLWYDTTESLSIDQLSADDFNCTERLEPVEKRKLCESISDDAKSKTCEPAKDKSESSKNKQERRRKKKRETPRKKESDDQQPLYRVITFVRNETDRMSCRATDSTTIKRRQPKTVRTNNVGLYGSNNRALNDLLKMNHDRQLFMM